MNFRHVCALLPISIFSSLMGNLPEVSSGKIVRWADFPSEVYTSVTVDIWTPEPLDPNGLYPVIYMHDGQMLYDASQTWNGQAWEVDAVFGEAIRANELPPVIVVGIHNSGANRWGDYFPTKVWESLSESVRKELVGNNNVPARYLASSGMRADAYLKFIVEELRPAIAAAFPVDPDPDRTCLMGSSMGGLVSWYGLCEYPDVFGRAACLSTHWIGMLPMADNPIAPAFIAYLDEHLPPAGKHRIYFDHGTLTLDAHYGKWQQAVDALMEGKDYREPYFVSHVYPGTNHSEQAWSSRLLIPAQFLLEE
jgi:enterochelin esterase-like enzyme